MTKYRIIENGDPDTARLIDAVGLEEALQQAFELSFDRWDGKKDLLIDLFVDDAADGIRITFETASHPRACA